MTAITLANIPSSINTYERLLTWAAQCVQSISNGSEVNVIQNQAAQPTCYVSVFKAADGSDRLAINAYLPVDYNALNSGSAKTWMATSDVGTATPHTNLLSN